MGPSDSTVSVISLATLANSGAMADERLNI
jgi:hypothetical protein